MAMYWGTSRWSAVEIMEAYTVARQCHLVPPVAEQTEYHMFHRDKVELQLPELCQKIGIGTMSWSPQAFGVLTGKFDEGQYVSAVTDKVDRPEKAICEESGGRFTRQHSKLQELSYIADRLGCSCNQLTIAWCLKSEHVHTVLVGASSVDQLYDHLGALQEPWLGPRAPIPDSPGSQQLQPQQHIALELDDPGPAEEGGRVQRFFASVAHACVIQ
ncbi:hypothetical protein HPB52_010665 [Rhipicephalus sanguineus]|uniref:NADP-dependent oxidoreductase domain-containing protein n=1 Tax=Rhipicephalus sanguineus TaxID=34632 RepID=A0A9D4PVH7_RHISA|nr:hypothetical protein HPB52_010665 [Rhipicephalus sanguineus]